MARVEGGATWCTPTAVEPVVLVTVVEAGWGWRPVGGMDEVTECAAAVDWDIEEVIPVLLFIVVVVGAVDGRVPLFVIIPVLISPSSSSTTCGLIPAFIVPTVPAAAMVVVVVVVDAEPTLCKGVTTVDEVNVEEEARAFLSCVTPDWLTKASGARGGFSPPPATPPAVVGGGESSKLS